MQKYVGPMLLAMRPSVDDDSQGNGLQDYSWEELKSIAENLSEYGRSSSFYPRMLELLRIGSTKVFDTGNTTIFSHLAQVRLIGLCQDQKSDGTGVAGLTFQFTHALPVAREINERCSNDGGFHNSCLHEWLNGEAFEALPDSFIEKVVGVEKWQNTVYDCKDLTKLESSREFLFLPSLREVYNYESEERPWYAWEGTGVNHDHQYLYYSLANTSKSNYSCLSGTSHTYHNDTPKNSSQDGHWLRSINSSNGSTYWYTSNNGFGSGYAANACLGVVPAFCF